MVSESYGGDAVQSSACAVSYVMILNEGCFMGDVRVGSVGLSCDASRIGGDNSARWSDGVARRSVLKYVIEHACTVKRLGVTVLSDHSSSSPVSVPDNVDFVRNGHRLYYQPKTNWLYFSPRKGVDVVEFKAVRLMDREPKVEDFNGDTKVVIYNGKIHYKVKYDKPIGFFRTPEFQVKADPREASSDADAVDFALKNFFEEHDLLGMGLRILRDSCTGELFAAQSLGSSPSSTRAPTPTSAGHIGGRSTPHRDGDSPMTSRSVSPNSVGDSPTLSPITAPLVLPTGRVREDAHKSAPRKRDLLRPVARKNHASQQLGVNANSWGVAYQRSDDQVTGLQNLPVTEGGGGAAQRPASHGNVRQQLHSGGGNVVSGSTSTTRGGGLSDEAESDTKQRANAAGNTNLPTASSVPAASNGYRAAADPVTTKSQPLPKSATKDLLTGKVFDEQSGQFVDDTRSAIKAIKTRIWDKLRTIAAAIIPRAIVKINKNAKVAEVANYLRNNPDSTTITSQQIDAILARVSAKTTWSRSMREDVELLLEYQTRINKQNNTTNPHIPKVMQRYYREALIRKGHLLSFDRRTKKLFNDQQWTSYTDEDIHWYVGSAMYSEHFSLNMVVTLLAKWGFTAERIGGILCGTSTSLGDRSGRKPYATSAELEPFLISAFPVGKMQGFYADHLELPEEMQ